MLIVSMFLAMGIAQAAEPRFETAFSCAGHGARLDATYVRHGDDITAPAFTFELDGRAVPVQAAEFSIVTAFPPNQDPVPLGKSFALAISEQENAILVIHDFADENYAANGVENAVLIHSLNGRKSIRNLSCDFATTQK